MKIKEYKSGARVTFEKTFPSGMYIVLLRNPQGDVHDKIKCDDYDNAREYYRAFCAIAKNMKG